MTTIHMSALSALKKYDRNIHSLKLEFAITEKEISKLVHEGLAILEEGKGFSGGVRNLCITSKGEEFINSYCDVCECMPCDCDWGHN